MKTTLTLFIVTLLGLQASAQSLNAELEYTSNITWPWNWDIATDQTDLIAVDENGKLNIKSNGVWENITVNPDNSDTEPRGVAIDEEGTIWITTTEYGLWTYDKDGEWTNYNAGNSFLPVDNLRKIAIQNKVVWISTDGLGLIRHDFNTDETTHYTTAEYTDLKTDHNLDPYIDAADHVWFRNREFLTRISPDMEWTNEDMRVHISGGNTTDIEFVSDTEIWISMYGGLVLYDGTNYNVIIQSQFDNYLQVLKDSRGDLWLARRSTLNGDGITIIHEGEEYFFPADGNSAIPSQVFGFVEYQDTVIAVGTIGNSIAKLVFDVSTSTSEETIVHLNVYPNPASEKITVRAEQTILNWSISNMSGQQVLKQNYFSDQIDVSGLSPGIYMLNITTDSGLVSKRITITNTQ